MKKILPVMLVLLLIVGALAACGTSEPEVIAAFGPPLKYGEFALTYHILNPAADYVLMFRFEDFESSENRILTSISMGRAAVTTDVGASVNSAEMIGRNSGEHRHLFGNRINWQRGGPTVYDLFDSGITVGSNSSGGTLLPGFISSAFSSENRRT